MPRIIDALEQLFTVDSLASGPSLLINYSSPVGSFSVGETVTGGISGATLVVKSSIPPQVTGSTVTGTFQVGETITGGTSGATATVDNFFLYDFPSGAAPLENGEIDFFESGSSTVRKTTYSDVGETIPNSNPLIIRGDGRVPDVYGTGNYRIVVRTSTGVQILSRDPVGGDQALTFGDDWSATQTYSESDVARDNERYWQSLTNNNANNQPSTDGGTNWAELPFDKISENIDNIDNLYESGISDWNPAIDYQAGAWARSTVDNAVYGLLPAGDPTNEPSASPADWNQVTTTTVAQDTQVNIPTDFPDLQAAFDFYQGAIFLNNSRVTVNIETGHALTKGLIIRGWNAGNLLLTSDDATVLLDATFSPAVADADFTGIGTNNCIIGAEHGGTTPYIDILIDANLKVGSGSGLLIIGGSTGLTAGGGKGIINAEFYGFLVALSSHANLAGCNFSASNWGCRATTGSNINVALANLDGVRMTTYGGSGTTAGLDVSRGSYANFKGAGGTARNCASRGIAARRSFVSAEEVDVSNAGTEGVRAENNSVVAFSFGTADDCGSSAITYSSSKGDCRDVSALNAAVHGILADDNSQVNARGAVVTGYGNKGIFSNSGSYINARDADARQDGINPSATDLSIQTGSHLNAAGAQGGTSVTVNTLSSSGVIYQ